MQKKKQVLIRFSQGEGQVPYVGSLGLHSYFLFYRFHLN